MTAVEEIQAAIEKLTASKPNLTACSEFQRSAVRHIARNCDMECECGSEYCGWDRYDTAPALDMLVRTIDAQLAILRDFLTVTLKDDALLAGALIAEDFIGTPSAALMALARAINGPAA